MRLERLIAVAFACAALALSVNTRAQGSYPNKPIRIVVPTTAGGAADIMTRQLAQKLSESMGTPVIVDNKPGGGNVVGSDSVAKAPPDGYTVLMTYTDHVYNPFLRASMPYDTVKDFAPVVHIGSVPLLVVVNPEVPARSIQDLIGLAKARPNQLNFASAGSGTSLHLAGELFRMMASIEVTHVPYKGTSPGFVDLLAGRVQFMFPTMVSAWQNVQSGKLRALATTGTKRAANLPDLPTVAEAGLPGYEASIWYAVLVPANTPRDIVMRLNAEFRKALAAPDIAARLTEQGFVIAPGTPEELGAKINSELDRWGKLIKEAKIKLD